MKISKKDWESYIKKLSEVNAKAADEMRSWVAKNGLDDMNKVMGKAYQLVTKYGEACATLTCEMYDSIAIEEAARVASAIPARTAHQYHVENALKRELLTPEGVANVVGRLVKQAGADTMLQNAKRDGAYFAWVPHGDTCAFCLVLASNGWQKASKKTIEGNHADHIHANCDCEFCIDFNGDMEIEGYDPDKYLEMYNNAEGDSPKDKVNSLRRIDYAKNKDAINAAKRNNYAKRIEYQKLRESAKIKEKGEGARKNYEKQNDHSLLKGLRSETKKLRLHEDKIANPEKYVKNFYSLDERYQKGLIEKWRKDVINHEKQIEIRKEILKERGVDYARL